MKVRSRSLPGAVCVLAAATLATGVRAQTAPAGSSAAGQATAKSVQTPPAGAPAPDQTNNVVVTAQRRSQRLQDVGIAVTALGAQDIAQLGHRDVEALTNQVPSLQVNQFAPSVTVFNIRGVAQNDFADAEEAPIAFYTDDVYVGSLGAVSGQNFDLQRIEVLRGPQGTLFGRNATGGLIQFISAKPTQDFTGYATITGGSFGEIASEAAISGPINDTTRVRLSFSSDEHQGYIHNAIGPDPGGLNQYAARLQLAKDLGDQGDLLVKAEVIRNDHDLSAGPYYTRVSVANSQGLGTFVGPNSNPYGTCNGCDLLGYKPTGNVRDVNDDSPNRFDRTFFDLAATYTRHLTQNITLTSITDYQNLTKGYEEDSDGTPDALLAYSTRQHLYQFSQELKLNGDTDRLNWTAGLYGLKIRSQDLYNANFADFDLDAAYGGLLNTDSGAAYAQGEYKLTDVFSLIAGVRYSYDVKTLDYHQTETDLPGQTYVFNQTNYPDLAKRTFADWSGKLELDYKPNRNLLVYASVNQGTKSGGFSTIAVQPIVAGTIPFKGEELTNYEGGVKTTWLQGRLHLDVSAYHYSYHDYQAYLIVGASQYVVNRDARMTGAEFTGDIEIFNGLSVNGFASWENAYVYNIELPNDQITDRIMPQAPKYTAGAGLHYSHPLADGKFSLNFDWKYNSSQYFSVFNAPVDFEPGYWTGDLHINYAFPGNHWEAGVFINNINDRAYRIQSEDITNPIGLSQSVYAPPRWFGGNLTYRF